MLFCVLAASEEAAGPARLSLANKTCQNVVFYAAYPFAEITPLKSVDLREEQRVLAGRSQGSCNAGWAFSLANVLQSLMISDFRSNRNTMGNPWLYMQETELRVSPQFIIENDFSQLACGGGDAVKAAMYLVANNLSVELETNFPYTDTTNTWASRKAQETFLAQKLSTKYLPMQLFNNVYSDQGCAQVPAFTIHKYNSATKDPAGAAEISRAKQHLSRGFAIPAHIQIPNDNSINSISNAINISCQFESATLATIPATIIGYGRKNGAEVWLVQVYYNGLLGVSNTLFVQMGTNSMCIEMELMGFVGKYYDGNSLVASAENTTRGLAHELDPEASCPYTMENNSCVLTCPLGYWPVDLVCKVCPITMYGICIEQCPSGFWPINGVCETCDLKYEGECVAACPTWAEEATPGVCTNCSLTQENVCVDSCHSGTIKRGNICIHCDILYEDYCVSACPDGTTLVGNGCAKCSLTYKGDCVDSCPDATVASKGVCVPCRKTSMGICSACEVVYNNTCVFYCPNGLNSTSNKCNAHDGTCAYTYQGICYHRCPEGTVEKDSKCVGTETVNSDDMKDAMIVGLVLGGVCFVVFIVVLVKQLKPKAINLPRSEK